MFFVFCSLYVRCYLCQYIIGETARATVDVFCSSSFIYAVQYRVGLHTGTALQIVSDVGCMHRWTVFPCSLFPWLSRNATVEKLMQLTSQTVNSLSAPRCRHNVTVKRSACCCWQLSLILEDAAVCLQALNILGRKRSSGSMDSTGRRRSKVVPLLQVMRHYHVVFHFRVTNLQYVHCRTIWAMIWLSGV